RIAAYGGRPAVGLRRGARTGGRPRRRVLQPHGWPDPRRLRAERRRQDYAPQGARGTDPPAAGVGAGNGRTGRDRVDRSPVPPVRTPHGTREPALLGGAVRGPRGAPRSPRRPGARASRHGRSRGSAGVVTLPGSGAARGDRQGRDPRSARPAARRAVHGARSRRGGRAPGAARRAAWWWRAGGGAAGSALAPTPG